MDQAENLAAVGWSFCASIPRSVGLSFCQSVGLSSINYKKITKVYKTLPSDTKHLGRPSKKLWQYAGASLTESSFFQVIYYTPYQRSSSIKGRLLSKAVFRQRSSSVNIGVQY